MSRSDFCTGGSDKVGYYASGSYTSQDGTIMELLLIVMHSVLT